MQYDTHVYLGPTLDSATAKQYLEQAHYHPPIQCGDLIRLLRLKPKRVLIIDGIYESVPAVWHKEIMLLLSQKIRVYGAASMGALRAAELYQYGMKGLGKVFEEFKSGLLIDDDEVAVLHQGKEENYAPVNEAMVNIRATCEWAYLEKKLSLKEKNQLIQYCKKQFYPYRSLEHAMKQLDFNRMHEFSQWYAEHGIIDLKRNDALLALQQIQAILSEDIIEEQTAIDLPATKFITSLIDEVEGTPFSFQASWLPDRENRLSQLAAIKPHDFGLINKLATLLKNTYINIPETSLPSLEHSLDYINKHQLYLPLCNRDALKESDVLLQCYTWIAHQISTFQITKQRIKAESS